MECEAIRVDWNYYLATDEDGDYALSRVPTEKFRGKEIPAKLCDDRYARFFKIERGDKIHLVGVGLMAALKDEDGDGGEYWVADLQVMWSYFPQLYMERGDKVFRTSILCFEMSKDLVKGWNALSDLDRNIAKDAIMEHTASNLYCDLDWDKCKRFKLDKATLEEVFDNMLADMFDADADSDYDSQRNVMQEMIEDLEEGIADMSCADLSNNAHA